MFVMFPLFVFAYSAQTTHPALTSEIIKFFNYHYPDFQLSDEEKELVIQGSIDEDEGIRPMRHFYDPVFNRGLIFGGEWQNSKEWGQDTLAQAGIVDSLVAGSLKSFFSGKDDYSWERALYEYAWGDKERGLLALGHVLHLLEDATVPAHSRNDPHPSILDLGSPYEFWTKKFNVKNTAIADNLINNSPILLTDLSSYFDALASYSNNNFFSKDTVLSEEYNKPEISYYFKGFGFSNNEVVSGPIVRRINKLDGTIEYTLVDKKRIILTAYWSRLSKQAVLHGAGVVKLFFDEVEKEQQTRALYKKNRSWFGRVFDATKEKIYNLAGVFYGTSVPYEELQDDSRESTQSEQKLTASVIETQLPEEPLIQEELPLTSQNSEPEEIIAEDILGPEETTETPTQEPKNPEEELQDEALENGVGGIGPGSDESESNSTPTPYSPGFGGGGGSAAAQSATEEQAQDTTLPEPPEIVSPADDPLIFTIPTILFSGTAEALSIIAAIYLFEEGTTTATTTTSISGQWNIALIFNQGTTTINFFAIDTSGNRSMPTTKTVFVDSIAPDVQLISEECQNSLAESGCLVAPRTDSGQATTTLHFSWSSTADDLNFFVLNQNGTTSTTTATSTVVTAPDNAAYIFEVSARDAYGNNSATSTKQVEVATTPVIINEIAWMGTDATFRDEWIELYNLTGKEINLSDWTLYAEDLTPYIQLSGTIRANGYYLLERKDDDTISDMSADLVYGNDGASWALKNSGESLFLVRVNNNSTTTIDEAFSCPNWCAGSNTNKRTMERYNPYVPGTDGSNWGTALGEFIVGGKDADGGPIKGTPKAKNSVSFQIVNGTILNTDKTLIKDNSPYLIGRSGFTVESGTTLTIEPGVVIKFVEPNEPSLVVEGTIVSSGAENNPIVFTSFADDQYGGDMNGDATSTSPAPGSWKQILIKNTSQNSSFSHTIIRYGGRWFNNMTMRSAVALDNADVTFQNTTIEHAQKHGLYLMNSESTIINSTFSNNNTDSDAAGIYVNSGKPLIQESTFENNNYGIYIVSSPLLTASSNNFTNNVNAAIYVSGPVGILSSNAGSGNGLNAIVIGNGGNITANGATTTLAVNPLSYLIRNIAVNPLSYLIRNIANVVSSSTLMFESGAVMKGHDSTGSNAGRLVVKNGGKIFHNGILNNELIFTSMHDDSIGSAVDNATTSPAAGDWYGIVINDGGEFSLSGFTLHYAGGRATQGGDNKGGIKIIGGTAASTIRNALIEKNYQYGIRLSDGARLTIGNSTLKDHTEKKTGTATALKVFDSILTLENIIFNNNELDIGDISDKIREWIHRKRCGSTICGNIAAIPNYNSI